MYVYIEEVFLTNFIADFLICRTLCAVRFYKRKTLRSAAAALVGTGYAFLALLNVRVFANIGFKILCALAMAALLGMNLSVKSLLIDFAILMALSGICGGLTLFFSFVVRSETAFDFFSFAGVTFIEAFAGVAAGCVLGGPLIRYFIGAVFFDKIRYECALSYRRRTVKAVMLADSGNLMCTLMKEPVCIVRESLFYALTGIPGMIHSDANAFYTFYDGLDDEDKKTVGLLPVATVTGEAVATVVKIDALKIGARSFYGIRIASCPISNESVDGIFNPVLLGGANHEIPA